MHAAATDALAICLMGRVTVLHSPGGMQRHLFDLASRLHARGHRVTVITAAFGPGGGETVVEGVRHVGVPDTRPESYRGGFFRKAARVFNRLHSENPFDVIGSQSIAALGLLGIVRRRTAVPIVGTLHGVWLSETEFEPTVRSLMSRAQLARAVARFPKILLLCTLLVRFGIRADLTILVSEWSRRELLRVTRFFGRKNIERKLRVIQHGISPHLFRPLDPTASKSKWGLQGRVLLCLGRLEFQKGVQVAIEAVAGMVDPAPTLVVTGKGSYEGALRALAERAAPGRVRFVGHVEDEELASIYSAADLFIYPELARPAFGLVAAEAMACGTPVVGSEIGAIPEVVSEMGALFRPGDAADLRARIETFFRSPEPDRRAISLRARERFDLGRTVSETVSAYREAAGRPQAG